MRICHCVMPTINPLACKNCNNNTEEYETEKMYTFDPYLWEGDTPSDEEVKKLFLQAYPRKISAEEVKEND